MPIHKGGSTIDRNNYIPISLLLIFDKIIKQIMHKKLYNFLGEHNILFNNQFGFRKNNSTSLALIIKITEQTKESIDNKKYGCGIFIDTVNHSILLCCCCCCWPYRPSQLSPSPCTRTQGSAHLKQTTFETNYGYPFGWEAVPDFPSNLGSLDLIYVVSWVGSYSIWGYMCSHPLFYFMLEGPGGSFFLPWSSLPWVCSVLARDA